VVKVTNYLMFAVSWKLCHRCNWNRRFSSHAN